MQWITTDLTKDSLLENIFTNTTIGGEQLIIYRVGDLLSVYDSNKENMNVLLPYPFKERIYGGIGLTILPKDPKTSPKYNVSLLGTEWFISYRLLNV